MQQPKLRKGLWSPEEDEKLYSHILRYGVGCWSSVPRLAGLHRCGKSCRLRWLNYLRPDLKRGTFSQEEEDHIVLGAANATALYVQFGDCKDGAHGDTGFGAADYSCVLDVSENLGYGESSSNSSNWNYGGEVGSVLDGEVLHWAKAEMERQHDEPPEHKFALPCQEQSLLANFEFNLEQYF
ncbi:unnamed protein product [Triticum turgidum subsp. durum]|uniref:Uncharacterized protein n=1 Tax=Triticum turgidum subsp. durum TaxID=4567 RepID=A0A9R0QGE4_TRITD|nr:unnamed protein product [Triticum turgidum subsp. durum]